MFLYMHIEVHLNLTELFTLRNFNYALQRYSYSMKKVTRFAPSDLSGFHFDPSVPFLSVMRFTLPAVDYLNALCRTST